MSLLLFNLLFFLPVSSCFNIEKDFPTENCSVEEQACEIHGDNLLITVPEVGTLEECNQICFDNENCSYISYFGKNSFPFKEVCMVFKECPTLHPCLDCTTEDKSGRCEICSHNIEGVLGDNIVQIIPDVANELSCKLNCFKNNDCQFYTYHSNDDPNYPKLCILLTEILDPVQSCLHCSTGPKNCTNNIVCGFFLSDGSYLGQAALFTEPSRTINVTSSSDGSCQLKILAIGGGGYASYPFGGAGSGEVSMVTYSIDKSTDLVITVGGQNKPSSVRTGEGELILMVQPGGGNDGDNGGNGYSGGGGSNGGGNDNAGNGGMNGEDGEASSGNDGGKGSGIDINQFDLDIFNISPAPGGVHVSGYICGGGGGGVFINGTGPAQEDQWQGQGYGGGAGCDLYAGLPGAILMETSKKYFYP